MKQWSQYQKDFFAAVQNETCNLQLDALAGSGKTTSIVEAFNYVKTGSKVLMCAFNASIKKELAARAPSNVEVSTLHSLGLKLLKKKFPKLRVDANGEKVKKLLDNELSQKMNGDYAENYVDYLKTVSLSKGCLAKSDDDIADIIDGYGIDYGEDRYAFISIVKNILAKCKENTELVDFDDMVWLPVALNLKGFKYDVIFVDEAQDMNACQIELILGCKGRIISVSDENQAIYLFRGADSNAVKNIISRCKSKRLPLSISYRCAKKIGDIARTIVPHFENSPTAEDGIVEYILPAKVLPMIRKGDFILSRTNAPLIKWCMELLKNRIPANIAGKDIGLNLLSLIKKSKAKTVIKFTEWLDKWRDSETTRLSKAKKDTSQVEDKVECLLVLCEGETSIETVKKNIQDLFADTDDSNRVILSTTHKAKGLERERVFILNSTYRPNSKSQEEKNLYYVAVTRAKKELYLVS